MYSFSVALLANITPNYVTYFTDSFCMNFQMQQQGRGGLGRSFANGIVRRAFGRTTMGPSDSGPTHTGAHVLDFFFQELIK